MPRDGGLPYDRDMTNWLSGEEVDSTNAGTKT